MKKRIIIGIISGAVFLCLSFVIGVFCYYNSSLAPTGDGEVEYVIDSGKSTLSIIDELKEKDLIKDVLCTKIYVKLTHVDNIQAGKYLLNKNMGVKEIFDILSNGKVVNENIQIRFTEGKRLTDYVSVIASKFPYEEKDILERLSNKEFLQSLIDKYWFITDEILNSKIKYPLEGYLYADTYELDKDATIDDIILKMIDTMAKKLDPYKEIIESNEFSAHNYLTLASIVELEASTDDDRANVAQVFYNRLNSSMTLGSDVTTYYAVNKNFKDQLTYADLQTCNAYNTRGNCVQKLPVGPICSPSVSAIKAVIEPIDNNYLFFVADKNKKVYFSNTSAEQSKVIEDLKKANLWLE